MTLQEALNRIMELENENSVLRATLEARETDKDRMNPLHKSLVRHLHSGPKSISELAELMYRENRVISQWLHQLKTRFGAKIVTLHDGKKQLENPEIFTQELKDSLSESDINN